MMKMSPSVTALFAALVKAQAEFPVIEKAKTAKVKSQRTNTEYSYDYADLPAILTKVRPVMAKHELGFSQGVQVAPDGKTGVMIETVLFHSSGEWIADTIYMPVNDPGPQAMGSAIAYGCRYGFKALAGIAVGGEDDDAKRAEGNVEANQAKAEVPHPTLVAAKDVKALVAAMNKLTPAEKKANTAYFNEQRKALVAAASSGGE